MKRATGTGIQAVVERLIDDQQDDMNPIAFLTLVSSLLAQGAETRTSSPPELGAVRFGDDFDAALAASHSSGKPVFLLFDEIPGCDTCTGFGAGPLSHPLLVEAIETEFVPVVVHNNKPGRDAEILARFGEPAWNNPVVRFVDADGKDVIPRKDGVWTTGGVAARMIATLVAAKRPVPEWLLFAAEEADDAKIARVTFAMHCYWDGQAALGAQDGVVGVAPGFIDGNEVVRVDYRPERLALADLVATAAKLDCAARVYAESEDDAKVARTIAGDRVATGGEFRAAPDSELLYHLRHSPLRFLPLTPLQAVRVNSDLGLGKDESRRLSPHQRELRTRIAARLREDKAALDDLERPDRTSELAAYTKRLIAKL